jgi:hypothetical protein
MLLSLVETIETLLPYSYCLWSFIANKLIRELQRKLPTHSLFETYQKDFLFYQQVLAQQPKDKNKIYSLHEPDVYVIALPCKATLILKIRLKPSTPIRFLKCTNLVALQGIPGI